MKVKVFYDKKFKELIIKLEDYNTEKDLAWFYGLLAERLFYSEYKILCETADRILETIDGNFADN